MHVPGKCLVSLFCRAALRVNAVYGYHLCMLCALQNRGGKSANGRLGQSIHSSKAIYEG